MRVDAFDFDLPPERISLRPARPRDAARMLVIEGEQMSDAGVADLPQWLRPGDCLVFNDTRVIPAQLEGRRGARRDGAQSAPGAKIGATLHKRIDLRRWQAFVRNAKRLRVGEMIDFGAGVTALAEERLADGSFVLAFAGDEPVELLLERAGTMPTAATIRRCSRGPTAPSPRRRRLCISRLRCSPR
jgi:S-adenosylmethionine:tRNA ribosyltransferase-isomerase